MKDPDRKLTKDELRENLEKVLTQVNEDNIQAVIFSVGMQDSASSFVFGNPIEVMKVINNLLIAKPLSFDSIIIKFLILQLVKHLAEVDPDMKTLFDIAVEGVNDMENKGTLQ